MADKQEKVTEKSEKTKQSKKDWGFNKHRSWYLGSLGAVVVIIIVGSSGYSYYYRNRIVPHTIVGGISVGGLTTAQAEVALSEKSSTFIGKPLIVSYGKQSWQVNPNDLQLALETNQAVGEAYQTGRSGSTARNFASKMKALFVNHSFSVMVAPLSNQAMATLQNTVLKNIETPIVQTSLKFTPGNVTIVSGHSGNQLNTNKFYVSISEAFASSSSKIPLNLIAIDPLASSTQTEDARSQAQAVLASSWTLQANNETVILKPSDIASFLSTSVSGSKLTVTVDQSKLNSYLGTIASKFGPSPVNATLAVNNGAVVISKDGTDGVALDVDQAAKTIPVALLGTIPINRTVQLTTTIAYPQVWSGNFASLGITQQIGTGTTSFSGSPSNRVANIQTGTTHINGQLVAPGADFSTVAALGPIDSAHGYVEGLVIINNETLPEDGGGLCQVSTTLFRAVLNAGLPVTARTPHSYEVSYYQRGIGPGLDATIYDPSPDFAWKNDTGHYVYIQGYITGTNLTFNLFGTSDGRIATINGPFTLSTTQPSGAPIYVKTNTLPTGKTELIDPPVPGAKTTATYTVTRNGQVINKQVFNSTYQAMPAQYLVGQ